MLLSESQHVTVFATTSYVNIILEWDGPICRHMARHKASRTRCDQTSLSLWRTRDLKCHQTIHRLVAYVDALASCCPMFAAASCCLCITGHWHHIEAGSAAMAMQPSAQGCRELQFMCSASALSEFTCLTAVLLPCRAVPWICWRM